MCAKNIGIVTVGGAPLAATTITVHITPAFHLRLWLALQLLRLGARIGGATVAVQVSDGT